MERLATTKIPTEFGFFQMIAYENPDNANMPHLAMVSEQFSSKEKVLVRIHSECMTGDVFGSKRCDCGEQLAKSLELTAKEGGVVVYLRQEGRGIGLINKMKAYNLQDTGVNTADANTHLGFEVDARQYDVAVTILQDLNIKSIRLLTNNPLKLEAIENSPIEIVDRVPIVIKPHSENAHYLKTKKDLMGHFLI